MSVDRISEDDIPADIVEAAMKACRCHSFGPKNWDGPLSTACLMVARAILAERERCAGIAEDHASTHDSRVADWIASAIRGPKT